LAGGGDDAGFEPHAASNVTSKVNLSIPDDNAKLVLSFAFVILLRSARLAPPGIICFSKDWHEDPTSNHHVLRGLARTRRVLWLNSVGTRAPRLSSGRDLGKIRRKLAEFARGPVNVENDLWVFSPLVLPLPGLELARAVNRQILRATIGWLRRKLGLERFQLWTFLPNVADYVGTLGEELAVYYVVDEWSMFSYIEKDRTVAAERALLERVDCVFTVNQALYDAKRAHHANVHLSPHGVDHAAFARALAPETEVPADLAAIAHPRIGFYGTIQDWLDFPLIAALARRRPDWQFVFLGQVLCDASAIASLPNVHLLGQRPHAALPAYCKGFDVGWIPYRLDERSPYINPLKLREYLSAGLPVASTAVPEVLRYRAHCAIEGDAAGFDAAIARLLTEDTTGRRHARSEAMRAETWDARIAAITAITDR
jgi:glycosyltransferase involved in cell wall biosynthesis